MQVYLALLLAPLLATILLNDWLYDGAEALLRALTGSRPGLAGRWTALGLEMGVSLDQRQELIVDA